MTANITVDPLWYLFLFLLILKTDWSIPHHICKFSPRSYGHSYPRTVAMTLVCTATGRSPLLFPLRVKAKWLKSSTLIFQALCV